MCSFEVVEARVIRMLRTRMANSRHGWPRNIKPVDEYIDILKTDKQRAVQSILKNIDSERVEGRYYGGRLAAALLNPINQEDRERAESVIRAICGRATHEPDERVLAQYTTAIGRGVHDFDFAVELVLELSHSESSEVRLCATRELVYITGHETYGNEAIDRLILLSEDEKDEIRDWATFALGSDVISADDTVENERPDVAAALVKRLRDSCLNARDEAINGLAIRHDKRGIAPLNKRLRMVTVTNLNIQSAGTYGDPVLYENLLAACSDATSNNQYDAWALMRCNPDPQIRASAPTIFGDES